MQLGSRGLGIVIALVLLAFSLKWGENPLFPVSYLSWTKVDQLHQLGFKGKGVTVAVVDEGFETNHPLIQSQFKEVGYNTDNHGENVAESRAYARGGFVSESHGTHVSGILVSQNPKHGGMAPGSLILPIKLGTQKGDEAFVRAFK
ncbi:MAG: S8 family serine peptidase, partial [Alphaproteobacteria bacterium]